MQKSKTATTIALILLFAMITSIIVIPVANAQVTWTIYIDATTSRIRMEVRRNNVRQQTTFTDIMLGVKAPGATAWTYLGPFSTTNGRYDYNYEFTKAGTHQFQYIVPPQGPLPTNPDTTDGKWYSEIDEVIIPTKKTYPYIGAMPNPVGVNQEVLLHFGITDQHSGGVGYGWLDLTVTVTRPDGTNETLGPKMTDSTGGTGLVYVPAMTGNYTLQTNFPEQIYAGVVRLASTSPPITLVVQEEPIQYYPAHALPTEYWTRPIDPQLREWSELAGNWLESYPANYLVEGNDYAPETAHILWAKPITTGGLVGEPYGTLNTFDGRTHSFEMGDAYEGKFINRFIVAGKLYYDKYATADPYHEIVCVDLHTGEELWSKVLLNNRTISFVQLMYWDTYDYHGVYDYLWVSCDSTSRERLGLDSSAGTTWAAFDPFTGDYVWCLYNIPSGSRVMGPKGEILIINVNEAAGYMYQWNSSNIPRIYSSTVYNSMGWGQWRAMGKRIDAQEPIDRPTTPLGISGYNWNVSIAGRLGERSVPGNEIIRWEGDKVVGGTISTSEVRLWGLNLNESRGTIGQLLFNETWNAPAEWAEGDLTISGFSGGWKAWSQESQVGVLVVKETRAHYGFSTETGKYLWGPTESQYYLDAVEDTPDTTRVIAYDKLYSASVSGIVYCYDVYTGERLWTYEALDPYSEILWANTWWLKPVAVADGKIYFGHLEHSPVDPRPRGAPFFCLNATTGEVIWRINGALRQTRWGGRGLMGDSILVTRDTYDNVIYAVGKGPSATTVTAGPEVTVHGGSVVVKGMVTDTSPGTQEYSKTARFPNGVPAVADANMSEWMLYVYKQFERPADAVGVEVVVEVLDPNNNFYEVARTTSDASGYFGCEFTPEVPGFYKIIATFEGSGAYYGSSAETFVNVEEAPQPTPPPTPTPAPMTDTYVTAFGIGIIIAIVAVGLLLVLMLRKR